MANAKATLFSIRGEVMQVRRGISPNLVDKYINNRLRQTLGVRTYWSDLIVRGVLAVPDAYALGRVAVTPGSPVVAGTGTSWPVSDKVNTTIRDGIFESGNQQVFPSSMSGIEASSILLVDQEGTPEIVFVNEVDQNSFWAVFAYPHNQDCSVLQSTLAGRQFRMGYGSPIFDVLAVNDPQTMTISQPWQNIAQFNQEYTISGMYYTIVPNMKKFLYVVDRQQGWSLLTSRSVENANRTDPQRTGAGDPIALLDIGASKNGLSLYEIWPTQTTARQIDYAVYTDWPELKEDNDRLPWFLNPAIFIEGALADAYLYKSSKDDYIHSPTISAIHNANFKELVELAKNEDESKMQQDWDSNETMIYGGGPGTLFAQSHIGPWSGDWYGEL